MFTFFTVLICVAVLAAMFFGHGSRGPARARRVTGASYEPTEHQVLHENILKDP